MTDAHFILLGLTILHTGLKMSQSNDTIIVQDSGHFTQPKISQTLNTNVTIQISQWEDTNNDLFLHKINVTG